MNTEIEFKIDISSFGRITALNVLFITAIQSECMVRDRANLSRYISKFLKHIENLSCISVNTEIEFKIDIS